MGMVDPEEGTVTTCQKSFQGKSRSVILFQQPQTGLFGDFVLTGDRTKLPEAVRAWTTAGGTVNGGHADGAEAEMDNAEEVERGKVDAGAAVHVERDKKKKAVAAAGASAKKQKKVSSSSSSCRTFTRGQGNNDAAPATASPGTRRSARVASSSSRATRPSSARHEPVIREEDNVAQDDGNHQVDEDNLRPSTWSASDDLSSLSDRMNHFEIRSEAVPGGYPL